MAPEQLNLNQRLTALTSRFDPVVLMQGPWLSHAPMWLNIFLIVLLAKSAAGLTWLILTPAAEFKINLQPVRQQNQPVARLDTVSRLHLFGRSQAKALVNTNITKTRLRLALKGVFASTNPMKAFAIIAESASAKGRTFMVGERLPSGAVLHEVRATEVILNRNGRLESLALPQKKLENLPISGATGRTRNVKTIAATNRLKKLRKNFVKSPQKFMENARLEPVINKIDGSTEGFTFNHNDPAVMRSLGLLPTDVITSINGQLISNNPNGAYQQLMQSLKNGTPLSIDLMRKGVPHTVNVQM